MPGTTEPNSRVAMDCAEKVAALDVTEAKFAFAQIGPNMTHVRTLLAAALLSAVGPTAAMADCQIGDAKLEEAILLKPELRRLANRQIVRDLRNLRDAAITLWSYGRHEDCERLLG